MTEDRATLLRLMQSHDQIKVLVLLMLEVLPLDARARETLRSRFRLRLEEIDQARSGVAADAMRDSDTLRLWNHVDLALRRRDTDGGGG